MGTWLAAVLFDDATAGEVERYFGVDDIGEEGRNGKIENQGVIFSFLAHCSLWVIGLKRRDVHYGVCATLKSRDVVKTKTSMEPNEAGD